jgi:translation elongation factor EF-Ts
MALYYWQRELIKKMREMTGYGMMDCRRALQENDWMMVNAVVWLVERNYHTKSGRTDVNRPTVDR